MLTHDPRFIGLCVCGRWLYEHGRKKEPGSGKWIYVCAKNWQGHFKFESVSGWWTP